MDELLLTASSGVQLDELRGLTAWRAKIKALSVDGVSAVGWFIGLEQLGGDATTVKRKRIIGSVLARHLGVDTADLIYKDGALWRLHAMMCKGLGLVDSPVGADQSLYEQARLYTYLPYRDGLVRLLGRIPFSAEATVHAYVRVVLEWARTWRALTLALHSETSVVPNVDHTTKHIALPLVVAHDLRSLIRLFGRREAGRPAPDTAPFIEDVAVETIFAQLLVAVVHLVEDPSLSALTAGNLVRPTANDQLAGALMRPRELTREQAALLTLVREHFVDRHSLAHDPNPTRSFLRADAEQQFEKLRMALGAFGNAADGEADSD